MYDFRVKSSFFFEMWIKSSANEIYFSVVAEIHIYTIPDWSYGKRRKEKFDVVKQDIFYYPFRYYVRCFLIFSVALKLIRFI